jgi:transcriptional regulator with XRE-family HTH domain
LWRQALGRQLRDERCARGERITDVAQRAGMSPQYLSEVERGRKDPSSEILSALAGAMDLTVRELTRRAAVHLSAGAQLSAGPVLLAA